MEPDVQLSQVDKLGFGKKTMLQTLNLSLLSSVCDKQSKVINLTVVNKFSTTKLGVLNKSEADLPNHLDLVSYQTNFVGGLHRTSD